MLPLKKNFIQYVGLNMLGMLSISCYILADTFFVAKAEGTVGMAALNFSIAAFMVMHGLGLMLGLGGATRFALDRQSGRKDAFVHTCLLAVPLALVFLLIAAFGSNQLAGLLGADAISLPLTNTYLQTILAFSPAFLFNNILLAFIRNDGNPKLASAAMLISSLSNILLDYIFIFPLDMGIFGAAFATGLSPCISLCVLSLHFMRKRHGFAFCRVRLSPSLFCSIPTLGFSALIAELASGIAMTACNLLLHRLSGNTAVAAFGVVANVALVAVALYTGIAQGMQPLASNALARADQKSLRLCLRYALCTSIGLSLFILLVIYSCTSGITAIFNSGNDALMRELAERGLRVYFIGFLFSGVNILSAAYFSAIADARRASMIALLRSCILPVPCLLLLSALWGINGIWVFYPVTEGLVFLLSCTFLVRTRIKKQPKLVDTTAS